ncbi:caspase family protein [Glycomyces luteolus]|uniref:Caspase family protein n=1 Tax=Glycomyces luteolus TaxID=2670330 RepID=A0A9X3SQ74_9ACTN|nr:caspase family protein [Glycomyces luteolus]MDA1359801.1 caspase family protein [Glycomyces luteolus]
MTSPSYRYRALLIANARFPEADPQELPELHGPPRDVTAVAEVLTDANVGLFDAADVMRLEDQPHWEINKQVQRFFSASAPDDVLLMYFSGHGRLDALGKLYLCTQNTQPDLLWATGIAFDSIDSLITTSPAKRVVIVLDCCHSGTFRGGGGESMTGRGHYLITSTREVQLAADEDGQGQPSPFTRQFVAAIREPGAPGPLSVPELYRRISAGFEQRGGPAPTAPVLRRG